MGVQTIFETLPRMEDNRDIKKPNVDPRMEDQADWSMAKYMEKQKQVTGIRQNLLTRGYKGDSLKN